MRISTALFLLHQRLCPHSVYSKWQGGHRLPWGKALRLLQSILLVRCLYPLILALRIEGCWGGLAVGADLSVAGVAVVVGPLSGAEFCSFASADSLFVGAAVSRVDVTR